MNMWSVDANAKIYQPHSVLVHSTSLHVSVSARRDFLVKKKLNVRVKLRRFGTQGYVSAVRRAWHPEEQTHKSAPA